MYIVTGAAGLIGSGLVWGLNQRGITDILLVDHLGTSEKWKNLRSLQYKDYEEKESFRDLILHEAFDADEIEGIIHMGACSATTERDASYLIDNNLNYSQELASYAVENDIKFIYASSCATYGDGSLGYNDDESQLNDLRPLNMYGYSKHMFDLWAQKHGLLGKITGLKFSNIYGCNEQHKANMRSVVCRAYEQITATDKMQLFKSYRPDYADGEQKRDFLYIKDAIDMVLFLFEHKNSHGIFNIGSGKAETWNDLVAAAFKALDKPLNIEYIDMPEELKGKYQYYTKANIDKLRKLGYKQETMSLDAAIKDYVDYRRCDKFLGDKLPG